MSHVEECREMLAEIARNRFTLHRFVDSVSSAIVPHFLITGSLAANDPRTTPTWELMFVTFPFFWLVFAFLYSDFFGQPLLTRNIHSFLERYDSMEPYDQKKEFYRLLKWFQFGRYLVVDK